jgi:hypothetical protein
MSFRFYFCRPFHRLPVFLILVSLVLAVPHSSRAQTVDVDRTDLARAQSSGLAPGFVNGQAVPSPNDPDLGEQSLVSGSQGYQPFTISAALPAYYTSNATLSRSHEQDDFIEAPVALVSYQPRLTSALYGVATVQEQLFYYDRFGSLNFGSFDAEAGLIYLIPQWHNLVLRGEFIYNRLTEKDSFEAFFNNYSIFVNAEIPFSLGQAQQISLGADANISVDADPEPPRRNDYEVYMGYSVKLTRAFYFDAVGRFVVRQYQLTDRVDVSEILAASARYDFNKYISASAISTLGANQSNYSVFDYKVANVGALLSLTVKF